MGGGGTAVQGPDGQWFKSSESRDQFIAGASYFAAISTWAAMLREKDYVQADSYFHALPAWIKERYWTKHPDQRAQGELSNQLLRGGAEYFLASDGDKLKVLEKYPQLREWLQKWGGDEAAMRGLIMAMYRAIPSTEAWLKRTFRERFPDVFGVKELGARRVQSVLTRLARNPEMQPFYDRAFALQSLLYTEQLKRSKVPPKPMVMERAETRVIKRRRRRSARLNSNWTMHRDLRLGR